MIDFEPATRTAIDTFPAVTLKDSMADGLPAAGASNALGMTEVLFHPHTILA
ncbi:hypothetical protein [Brucella tritici]|uniref:hypothetical protein n=1 Tax=Brucella tritici TaxID=94626 RepID=UPI002001ABFF|nr:hypothetical protein [Brucella tritici]